MKPLLMTSLAVLALASCGLGAQAADKAAPTPAEAKAFINKAEADLAKANTYAAKDAWVRATYITEDTKWLEAKAGAEQNEMATRLAKQAARYNAVKVDAVTRRKLDLLKRSLVLPAPNRPGAADALATIASRLDSTYSTGKFSYAGKTLTLNDAEDILASSRDPAVTKAVWEGWRTISPQPMTPPPPGLSSMITGWPPVVPIPLLTAPPHNTLSPPPASLPLMPPGLSRPSALPRASTHCPPPPTRPPPNTPAHVSPTGLLS